MSLLTSSCTNLFGLWISLFNSLLSFVFIYSLLPFMWQETILTFGSLLSLIFTFNSSSFWLPTRHRAPNGTFCMRSPQLPRECWSLELAEVAGKFSRFRFTTLCTKDFTLPAFRPDDSIDQVRLVATAILGEIQAKRCVEQLLITFKNNCQNEFISTATLVFCDLVLTNL